MKYVSILFLLLLSYYIIYEEIKNIQFENDKNLIYRDDAGREFALYFIMADKRTKENTPNYNPFPINMYILAL